MSKEIKKSLVPKLRFPQFRDAEERGEKKVYKFYKDIVKSGTKGYFDVNSNICKLSTVCEFKYGKALDKADRYDDGKYPAFGANGIKARTNKWLYAKPSIVIGRKGSAGELNFVNERFWALDVAYYVDYDETKVNIRFLYYSLQIKNIPNLAKGVKPGVSRNDLYSLDIYFPPFEEQTAIADCLSSIDELITAQIQKIDALKAHKKGLMQKLFPTEGETIPKLRFPEFRDAGEWEEMRLGEVAQLYKNPWKVGDENLPYIALKHIQENEFRITNIGNSDEVASNKNRFTSNHFLFGKLRPYLRKLYRPDFDGICSTDIWVVEPKTGNDKDFLFYFFANQAFIDSSCSGATGTRMPRADWNFIKETKWNIPPLPEQTAIADCLSPIDKLITAQAQKIDALKAHKKSLMQKLFPSH